LKSQIRQASPEVSGNGPYQAPSMVRRKHAPTASTAAHAIRTLRYKEGMAVTIPVAHDFVCPWCWIGLSQIKRLKAEFGVEFEWRAYELFPEGAPIPPPRPSPDYPPDRPETPNRMALAYAAEGMVRPPHTPPNAPSHNAHEAAEFAKSLGVGEEMIERIYLAYWMEGRDANDSKVLEDLARGLIEDVGGLRDAIRERRFRERIVPFPEAAHASGVYNVPTFWIGGERYAEQPYSVLRKAVAGVASTGPESVAYPSLEFPPAPPERPYVFCNMVATIDGKTVTGLREEGVMDLGSPTDHATMRRIELAAQAVLIGAGTLRASRGLWFPRQLFRIVATRSRNLDYGSRFFTDAPEKAIVLCPSDVRLDGPSGVRAVAVGSPGVDFAEALRRLRSEFGISRLLCEGGSELNAELLAADLVDELFLTIAPKVKLGRDTPTYAGGSPLPREEVRKFDLIDERRMGDEVFLRYRRVR